VFFDKVVGNSDADTAGANHRNRGTFRFLFV
jgi:hypothetical protein